MASNGNQSSKVFFITGISTGFGRSIVEHALDAGHYVIGTTRNGTVPYEKHSNLTVLPLSFKNLEDVTDVKSVIDKAYSVHNRIDVVINNAGYAIEGAAVEEYSIKQGKEMYDVNVWGVVAVIQAVLPYLRKQGNGHIINISSIQGLISLPGFSLYASSKWALESISESLAAEVKEYGIYVNVAEPGASKTEVLNNIDTPDHALDIYEKYHHLAQKLLSQVATVDVNKFADSILYIVDNASTLPLRIPLGKRSFNLAKQKSSAQLDDLKKIESLAASVDISSPVTTSG